MFITCSLRGLGRALANPRLAIVLWLVNAVLAAMAALPAFLHLSSVLGQRPEGDRLLRGFSFGLLAELNHYQGPWGAILLSMLLPVALAALLGNALTSGGVLEVLTASDDHRLLHRFGRGAGHFFGRFFRAGATAGVVALAVAGLLALGIRGIGRLLENSAWEPMGLVVALVRVSLVALVALVVLMALDLARARMVIDDSRQAIRLFFRSLLFVLRHPVKVLGLWAINSLLLLVVLAAYLVYCQRFPASGGRLILAMVVVQQAVMLARAGLRVALWGSEIALWERMAPPAQALTPEPAVEPMAPDGLDSPAAFAPPEVVGPSEGSLLMEAPPPEAAPEEPDVPTETPAAPAAGEASASSEPPPREPSSGS